MGERERQRERETERERQRETERDREREREEKAEKITKEIDATILFWKQKKDSSPKVGRHSILLTLTEIHEL